MDIQLRQTGAAGEHVGHVGGIADVQLVQTGDGGHTGQVRKEAATVGRGQNGVILIAYQEKLIRLAIGVGQGIHKGIGPGPGLAVLGKDIVVLRHLAALGHQRIQIGIEADGGDGLGRGQNLGGGASGQDVSALLHRQAGGVLQLAVARRQQVGTAGELQVQCAGDTAAEDGRQGVVHSVAIQPNDSGDDGGNILGKGDDGAGVILPLADGQG